LGKKGAFFGGKGKEEKTLMSNPGAGAYNVESGFNTARASRPTSAMFSKSTRFREKKKEEAPGPGEYAGYSSFQTKGAKMGTDTKRFEHKTIATPGPGSYTGDKVKHKISTTSFAK
jgi:hypothetical protein